MSDTMSLSKSVLIEQAQSQMQAIFEIPERSVPEARADLPYSF